ncbi:MAG: hypothetical protein WBB22_16955, partial [Anaerolineae bacterium]
MRSSGLRALGMPVCRTLLATSIASVLLMCLAGPLAAPATAEPRLLPPGPTITGIASDYYVGDTVSFHIEGMSDSSATLDWVQIRWRKHRECCNSCDVEGGWIYYSQKAYSVPPNSVVSTSGSFSVVSEFLRGPNDCTETSRTGAFEAQLYGELNGSLWYSSWSSHLWTAHPAPDPCIPEPNTIDVYSVDGTLSGVEYNVRIYNNGCGDLYSGYRLYIDGDWKKNVVIPEPIAPGTYLTLYNEYYSMSLSPGAHTIRTCLTESGGD